MANKNTLKGYFETGDIPNQSQYQELIDSNLNLNETGTQILVGTLSSSFLEVENHITASGNIRVSGSEGNIYLNINGQITASGNISASGEITANKFYADGAQTSYISLDSEGLGLGTNGSWKVGTHITASGNISASGDILAANLILKDGASNSFGNIHVNTTGYSNGIYTNNTGSFIADPTQIYVGAANPGPSQINFATQDHPNTLKIFKGNITASGNISASGTIYADNFQSAGGDVAGISFTDDLVLTGHLTASGNISSSGTVIANEANIIGHITASGNISASGNILANNATIAEQLDMTSASDSIFNMYQESSLITSFHSRGNLNSFIEAGNSTANLGVGTSTPAEKLTVHGNISGSGNLQIDGSQVDFTNLPTSDPGVAGRLYNDSGTVKISL